LAILPDNEERGLYKTVDGGKSWTKSLAIKSEGAMSASSMWRWIRRIRCVYAATYDKVRPLTFAEGGPGSGLYKDDRCGQDLDKS
jgi:hypothetical protein